MKPVFSLVAISLCVLALIPRAATSGETEDHAVNVAKAWLDLVDHGEYAQSWQDAAALFKTAVTVEQWQRALNAARKPLGELTSRKLKGSKYVTSLPGAPDGEYVVVQFDSSFANKKEAVETVTPMKDEDGIWRVSGYYVK